MTFEELLDQALAMLQRRGRVAYSAFKRQFDLDEAYLEDLKDALLFTHPQVIEADGRGLVWTGDSDTIPTAPSAQARPPSLPVDQDVASPAAAFSPVSPRTPETERRQLTVLFCDLVGAAQLASQLELEDLREVARAYQETATTVVRQYAGHIAQYLGDGLLVYFGYLQARADDAQHAVRTGLEIVEALAVVNTRLEAEYGVRLALRVGIHTGPVAVGEGGADQPGHLARGETPTIAIMLQGLAEPNTVLLSAATAPMVQEAFVLQDLGTCTIEGVDESVAVFRALGRRETSRDGETTT
jgi:class 3 adenylate cyclase